MNNRQIFSPKPSIIKKKWAKVCKLIGYGGFKPLSTERLPKVRGDSATPEAAAITGQGGQGGVNPIPIEPNHSRRCHCAGCIHNRTVTKIQEKEQETDWTKYNRVIIEYCCYPDSLMGKKTQASKGCKVIRVTTTHDQTTEQGYNWLVNQIRKIPADKPILLWGSIPCTGGTPWARYNLRRYPETFPKRLRQLRAEWRILTYNFFRISNIIQKRWKLDTRMAK